MLELIDQKSCPISFLRGLFITLNNSLETYVRAMSVYSDDLNN